MKSRVSLTAFICILFSFWAGSARSEDWPQWRGPRGDGTWNAPKLPVRWPENGLSERWKKTIGGGYAGVIVADGRVYNADRLTEPKEIERIQCLEANTGDLIWEHADPVEYADLSYGNGPRAAPTVFDGRLYTLGALGQAHCFDARTGALLWSKHLQNDFDGRMPTWGFAASPYIFENTVILTPGSKDKGSIIALDRVTGDLVWKSLSDETTYATPVLVEHAGRKEMICWMPTQIRSLDPHTGKLLWSHPYKVDYNVSIATPVYHQGIVLVSGYWDGARAMKLPDKPGKAALAWENRREYQGLMSQPLCRDGIAYLLCRNRGLQAFEIADGKKLWDDDNTLTPRGRNPQATLVWLNDDDRIIALNSEGELILARINRSGYHDEARTKIIGPTWAHPAYAGRYVFARNDNELICVELPVVE